MSACLQVTRGGAISTLVLLFADGSELPFALPASYSTEALQHIAALISHHAPAALPAQDEHTLSLLEDVDVQTSVEPDEAAALVAAQAALLRRISAAEGAEDLAALPRVVTQRVRTATSSNGSHTVDVVPAPPEPQWTSFLACFALAATAACAYRWHVFASVEKCVVHRYWVSGEPSRVDLDCAFSKVTLGAYEPERLSTILAELWESKNDPWLLYQLSEVRSGLADAATLVNVTPGSDDGGMSVAGLLGFATAVSATVLLASCVLLWSECEWQEPRRARLVIDPARGTWRLQLWHYAWAWLHRVPGTAATFHGAVSDLEGCVVCFPALALLASRALHVFSHVPQTTGLSRQREYTT